MSNNNLRQMMHQLETGTLSRRSFIQRASALGLSAPLISLALAACGGSNPQKTQGRGEFHGAFPYQQPPAGTFNTFAPTAIALGVYWDVMEMALGIYKWEAQDYIPMLATAWEMVPPDTFKVTLRKNVKWSDGSAFGSKDVITTFTLLRVLDNEVWQYLDSIQVQGDDILFKMKRPSTVVEYSVMRAHIRADSVYGTYAQKAQTLFDQGKGTDTQEIKDLATELTNFQPKEMVVNGPYQIDTNSITASQLSLKRVPTAWNANTVNFEKIVLYNGETPAVTPLLLSKQVDFATHGFPPATLKALREGGIRLRKGLTLQSLGLIFNYARVKAVQDPRVRQAIAMAFDRNQTASAVGSDVTQPFAYLTGVPDPIIEKWVEQSDLDKLNKYEYNPNEADRLMQEAGFKKENGVWVSPDGERMEYDLYDITEYGGEYSDNIRDQLTRWGIKVTLRTLTFSQFTGEISKGNFQLGTMFWAGGNPHPYYSYVANFLTYNTKASGGGMHFPLQQTSSTLGTIDFGELTVQSAEGLDEQKQKTAVTKIATAFNELLPYIPVYQRMGNLPLLEGTRVTGWPPDSDPLYQNSVYADNFCAIWLLEGQLKSVGH